MNVKLKLSILATACALWLAIPLAAANPPAAKTNQNMSGKKTARAAMRNAWAPETLEGKIAMVDPARKLVVVETPNGVPFDMVVTAKTRIDLGNRAVTLSA